MKGRPPDPTRAKRGTGNRPQAGQAKKTKPGMSLVKRDQPTVVEGTVVDPHAAAAVQHWPMPPGLPAAVQPVWDAAVADLGGAGRMRDSYVPQLAIYCESVWLNTAAAVSMHEDGIMLEGPDGRYANPMVKIHKDTAATILRYADSLGLSPGARIRLALEQAVGMTLLQSIADAREKRDRSGR